MPELPEVETVKQYLDKVIKNKVISDVVILHNNIICGDYDFFKKSVIGKKIVQIKRYGKYLIFVLDKKFVILAHLRMEGKYIFFKNQENISKYARVVFFFKNGGILNYDDSRAFGKIHIKNKSNYFLTDPLKKIGQEAIENINVNQFYNLIHKKKKNIKTILLDQSIISGIGNIYVTEILFKSKISPLTKANKLNKNDLSTILKNAKCILLDAIKLHGCSAKSFTYSSNKKGQYQNFLQIYGKNKGNCPVCNNKLTKIKISNRGTIYCNKCQITK
ncbi:MAG: DNA-formamidopyrimidine glycosylase [Bacilli bacterium]|nr:DNA-formamidopyrimidine glycosylase [Bacilli bacterium]